MITDGLTDELEIFAKAASDIISGKKLSDLGKSVKTLSERVPLRATIDKDVIIGSIIFIDSYGNAISNITREVFYRVFENKAYRILIQSNKNYTDQISERYSDVPVGEMLARFNQLDLLEISINGADVSELLSLSVGSVVRVDHGNKDSISKPFILKQYLMNDKNKSLEEFNRLLDIIDELRVKCPWDMKQTNESLRKLTIEETYELADAIFSGK